MYDLDTKFDISAAGFARIYGDRLVWDDGRQDNPDADPISNIHMYDLSTKKLKLQPADQHIVLRSMVTE